MWKYPVILISRKRFIDLTFTVITILFVPVLARAVIWTWCVGAVGVGVTRAGFTFIDVCKHSKQTKLFLLDNIRKYYFFPLPINSLVLCSKNKKKSWSQHKQNLREKRTSNSVEDILQLREYSITCFYLWLDHSQRKQVDTQRYYKCFSWI